MSRPTKKIPSLTIAALAITTGCNDGKNSDTKGVDVSAERINSLFKSVCQQYKQCYPSYFAEYYSSIDECVDELKSYVGEIESYDPNGDYAECIDTVLDYYTCFLDLSCKQIENGSDKCYNAYYAALVDNCEFGYYSYSEKQTAAPTAKRPILKSLDGITLHPK